MHHTFEQLCWKVKSLLKNSSKMGERATKKSYFFLPTQPLFWQGWENRVFIYGAVCCGFSTITEWQCLDWKACWRFMGGGREGAGTWGDQPSFASYNLMYSIDWKSGTFLTRLTPKSLYSDKVMVFYQAIQTLKNRSFNMKVWKEIFQAEPNLHSPEALHCCEVQFQCLEGGQ